MIKFGEVVKELRKKKGLKQKEFAEILGITAPFLSQVENNEQKPSVGLLAKIADYFDLPVSALVFKAHNINQIKSKEQQKYFKAAQPVIDSLIEFILSGDSKTKGKNPLNKIKTSIPRRKKA